MDWKPVLGLPLWFWLFVLPTLIVILCAVFKNAAAKVMSPVWWLLNKIYDLAGVIAAMFMVSILLIIVAQMLARWFEYQFPGSTDYAGYAMAATSFFALAHALNRGAHIRVSILLNLNQHTKYWLNGVAMFIAALTATYFARFAIKANFFSEMLNDRTQGLDQVPERLLTVVKMFGSSPSKWSQMWAESGTEWVYTPIWLPQLSMSIGSVLLAIALWDNLTRLVVTRESAIKVETVE
jgi:TRAP-type C4-dicarboxylate transport system permease small subunit